MRFDKFALSETSEAIASCKLRREIIIVEFNETLGRSRLSGRLSRLFCSAVGFSKYGKIEQKRAGVRCVWCMFPTPTASRSSSTHSLNAEASAGLVSGRDSLGLEVMSLKLRQLTMSNVLQKFGRPGASCFQVLSKHQARQGTC